MTRKFIKFGRSIIDVSKIITITSDSDGNDGYIRLEGQQEVLRVYGEMSKPTDLFIKIGDIEVYEAK
jgi:hypothetical protein